LTAKPAKNLFDASSFVPVPRGSGRRYLPSTSAAANSGTASGPNPTAPPRESHPSKRCTPMPAPYSKKGSDVFGVVQVQGYSEGSDPFFGTAPGSPAKGINHDDSNTFCTEPDRLSA